MESRGHIGLAGGQGELREWQQLPMSQADGGSVGETNGESIIGGNFVGAQHGGSQEVAGAAGVGDCAAVVLGGVGGN